MTKDFEQMVGIAFYGRLAIKFIVDSLHQQNKSDL